MNIDFMKWLVDKAEGFEIVDGMVFCKNEKEDILVWTRNRGIISPSGFFLLMQRAIEGVNSNTSDDSYFIEQGPADISVYKDDYCNPDKVFWFDDYNSIDQAKEAALQWVKENEG